MAVSFLPFWLLLLLGMPVHLPLSLPPLPPDPTLAAMAPQECLWYVGLAGVDKVNPASKNKVEQLLAEDDVVNFQREVVARLERSVAAATQNDPRTKVVGEEGPKLVATLLSRPLCAYIASASPGPHGPMIRGGMAVNLGDDAAAVKTSLERIEQSFLNQGPPGAAPPPAPGAGADAWHTVPTPPDVPRVQWGVKDKYLVVAIGEGEADSLWARRTKPAPEWLTKLTRDAKVPRPAVVQFINLSSLVGMAKSALVASPNGAQVQQLFDAFGLNNLKSYSSVGGLDADGYVETALLSTDGQSLGFLSMLGGKTLTAESLSPIPDDAGYAVAARIDPSKLWEMLLKFAGLVEPGAPAMIDQGLNQVGQQTDVNLKDDVVASLGDTWCLYNSPGDGGLIFTGLTVTGTIRDCAKLVAANEKLVAFAKQVMAMAPPGAPVDALGRPLGRTTISEAEFRGQKIYFLNFVGERSPVSPAWCITDSQLVIGLFPQTLKAYLQRQSVGGAASAVGRKTSLAVTPGVAALFSSGGTPSFIGYEDTPNTFRFAYPLAQVFAQFVFSGLQQEGIDLDISILPNARAIKPHLKPSTFSVQSTSEGIRLEAHGTLPSGLEALPLAASVLLPATFTARQAAECAESMNNLKQLSLALLNFEAAEKSFPPAFDSNKDGKPLLSWRVLMLPYIGEQQLYSQFRLDEPWDSENNKKLIAQMPRIFVAPESKAAAEFKTVYLGVRGEKAAFTGVEGVEIRSFTDGTSKTITVVEANDNSAVIWTKPDDFAIDTPNPMASLAGLREGGFLAAFADGHVQMISDAAPANIIKALFTRNGGEVVDLNAVSR